MTPPKGPQKWLFWQYTFLRFFSPLELSKSDASGVKMCLECVHVCQMGPPFGSEGLLSGSSEGVRFGSLFGPFFEPPFDFCESLKRYENRHLSVFEPSEGAFFGSFRRVDFRWKKTPRCFVYRHFSDFRYLRKDVFWGEILIILMSFGGLSKIARMPIYTAFGRLLRCLFFSFFMVFAFSRFLIKPYVYKYLSDF